MTDSPPTREVWHLRTVEDQRGVRTAEGWASRADHVRMTHSVADEPVVGNR